MNSSDSLVILLPLTIVFWGWVVWVILEWRKMRHKSNMQNKILDKFSTVQELNEFLQTGVGENFLRLLRIDGFAPREKILSSLTKGIIFSILGIALVIVPQIFEYEEIKFFSIFGIIIFALGIGFLISTWISYNLSKKWGIINDDRKNL